MVAKEITKFQKNKEVSRKTEEQKETYAVL